MKRAVKLGIGTTAVVALVASGVALNRYDVPDEVVDNTVSSSRGECSEYHTVQLAAYIRDNSNDKQLLEKVYKNIISEQALESSNDCKLAGILYAIELGDFDEARRLQDLIQEDADGNVFGEQIDIFGYSKEGVLTTIDARKQQSSTETRQFFAGPEVEPVEETE